MKTTNKFGIKQKASIELISLDDDQHRDSILQPI